LASIAISTKPDVIIPITEASLLAIQERPSLWDARVPFPELPIIKKVLDKASVCQLAPEFGIAVPRQQVIAKRDDLSHLDEHGLTFPVVVKPARSVSGVATHRIRTSVTYVSQWADLVAAVEKLPAEAFPLLIQQRVVGPGTGVFLFLAEGRILARFAHRRLREKPPSGGVSVYRESVAADDCLVDKSAALLNAMGWSGVAMVEYKTDAGSGEPYLMEINGRLWGSLQLAIDAGVDFPTLLVKAALEEPAAPVTEYQLGIRSRWWWGDVDQLLARLRRSDTANNLPPGSPTRLQAVLDFMRLWRPGDRSEVLRISDMRPFLRETWQWLHGD